MKRALEHVKTKQNPKPREGKVPRSPVRFLKGDGDKTENVASLGPPQVTTQLYPLL